MSDRLTERFEEFRADSMARTAPPGVVAVRRRVARRHATRAIVLVLVALGIVAGAWLPARDGHGGPAVAPTAPAPSPSVTTSPLPVLSASPSTPSTPGKPSSGSGSTSHAPTQPATPTGKCTAFPNSQVAALLGGGDPDVLTLSTQLLNACPNGRVKVVRATYTAAGTATPKNLTLYASFSHTLSAAHPSTTMAPGQRPAGSCYSYVVLTLVVDGALPHSIANPIGQLDADGDDIALAQYWSDRGDGLIGTSWGDASCGG